MLKRVVVSRWTRVVLSMVLIVVAFRKVDVLKILAEIRSVPWWFSAAMVLYLVGAMAIVGIRWSLLVLERPKMRDFFNFTRAGFVGAFYGLLFPSAVAGDVVKWLPLLQKYPEVSKTKLVSSVLIDRIVGFTAFSSVGLLSMVVGKLMSFEFPNFLWWLFGGLFLGVAGFYLLVFSGKLEEILERLAVRIPILRKVDEMINIFKVGKRGRIGVCLLISLLAEPIWILPIWFYSLIFKAGIDLLAVFIFVPITNLILVLPISIAGFGARENLLVYFFLGIGVVEEKILAVSAFSGIMVVVLALLGGLLLLI